MDTTGIEFPILDRFQRLSDWIQLWFGFNNFDIATVFKNLVLFCLIIRGGLIIYISQNQFIILDIMFLIIGVLLYKVMTFFIQIGKKIWENNPTFQNPLAINMSSPRLLFIFMCIAFGIPEIIQSTLHLPGDKFYKNIYTIVQDTMDIFLTLYMYFGSCTPKPYKESKVKKFVNKIIESVQKIKSPETELSPT